MHAIPIVAIVFGGLILALAIIGSTILMGLKIIKGGISSKDQKIQKEDVKIIQEIYKGLAGMEERIESLETIILDHERKD